MLGDIDELTVVEINLLIPDVSVS